MADRYWHRVHVSVTANGALHVFGDAAGTAVTLYYCIQSLIVGIVGTLMVILLPGDTAWPLIAYCVLMGLITLLALAFLKGRRGEHVASGIS